MNQELLKKLQGMYTTVEMPVLSPRGQVAAMALQALIIGNAMVNREFGSSKDLAADALTCADDLLAALEKTDSLASGDASNEKGSKR